MYALTALVIIAVVVVIMGSYVSKTDWWEKHICADFSTSGHNAICFDCNMTDPNICYTDKCPIIIHKNDIECKKIIF